MWLTISSGGLQGCLLCTTIAHRKWVGDDLVVDVGVVCARLLIDPKDCGSTRQPQSADREQFTTPHGSSSEV